MAKNTPITHRIIRRPPIWPPNDPASWRWGELAELPPFTLADGSRSATQQTSVRMCYDSHALYVRFDCQDDDIWGTYTRRDEPIYDEEAVELFIAPGTAAPARYYEFEISPNGVLFDARIDNSAGVRAKLIADTAWDAPAQWHAERDDTARRWHALLTLPWAAIAPEGELPLLWRANFYRIERPRGRPAEFSCWSPTLVTPPDFHIPQRFGLLQLVP